MADLPATTDRLAIPTGDWRARLTGFAAQPAIRRALPWIVGIGGMAAIALAWMALATGPQRTLYGGLDDGERAEIAAALEAGGIAYAIDPSTGALSVGEDDLYRAKMLVATETGLVEPETTAQMLDSIPLGSSRTLEGERLRNIRERELTRTIAEIDGVEAVRVHLAQGEASVFVRESVDPSASVMLRLKRGRRLNEAQVSAIVNLVAGSVPRLEPSRVRVVDQHGSLLTGAGIDVAQDRLERQAAHEEKLRAQIAALLRPMLGEGNFSSEVQVELDFEERTAATESWDKDGVVRSETSREATMAGERMAGGVPGVLANTPPPPARLGEEGEAPAETIGGETPSSAETTAQRTYELGREVAVTTQNGATIRRLTVAVALSKEALAKIAPADAGEIEELVAAAVGASEARGDTVKVMTGSFEPATVEDVPFWESGWFALILRHGVALIGVVLAVLFGVRPLVRAVTRRAEPTDADAAPAPALDDGSQADTQAEPPAPASIDEQVGLARTLAAQQPDRAAAALRRMLAEPAQSEAA